MLGSNREGLGEGMIVCDVEATGLDRKVNSIVSLGAVDFEHPRNIFYRECRIFKGAKIDNAALRVNGFSIKEIKSLNKISLKQLMIEFIRWAYKINDITIAGQNPGFDLGFIASSLERYGLENRFRHRTIDLHSECYDFHIRNKMRVPLKNSCSAISLDYTLKLVGLMEEPRPHNALVGAKLEAEAFSRLLHGKSLFKEYGAFPIPRRLKSH